MQTSKNNNIIANGLDQEFIEEIQKDPVKWNAFLQRGRALVRLEKTLASIAPLAS